MFFEFAKTFLMAFAIFFRKHLIYFCVLICFMKFIWFRQTGRVINQTWFMSTMCVRVLIGCLVSIWSHFDCNTHATHTENTHLHFSFKNHLKLFVTFFVSFSARVFFLIFFLFTLHVVCCLFPPSFTQVSFFWFNSLSAPALLASPTDRPSVRQSSCTSFGLFVVTSSSLHTQIVCHPPLFRPLHHSLGILLCPCFLSFHIQ